MYALAMQEYLKYVFLSTIMWQSVFIPTKCFSSFHGWTQDLNKWVKNVLLYDTVGEILGKCFFGILSFYNVQFNEILNKLETPYSS